MVPLIDDYCGLLSAHLHGHANNLGIIHIRLDDRNDVVLELVRVRKPHSPLYNLWCDLLITEKER